MCPLCEDVRLQRRVTAQMRAMSAEDCVRLAEELLRPFLLSLSALFPVPFPAEWVARPPSGAPCFFCAANETRSLRFLYLAMCTEAASLCDGGAGRGGGSLTMLAAPSVGADGAPRFDVSRLVERIALGGEHMYSRLVARRRPGFRGEDAAVCVVRTVAMIEEVRGLDVVFHRLQAQLDDICCGRPAAYTPLGLCRFACGIGHAARMRAIAVSFLRRCHLRRAARMYLSELILRLDGVFRAEAGVCLAVAMALHPRLGAASGLAALGEDLLPWCVPRSVRSPIGGWRNLLQPLATGKEG